jgi:nifR3 family TIM-barrel protein
MRFGYSVGAVTVKPGLVLSPMSGVTTAAFRRLIKRLNGDAVGLLVSEFVSVEGMTRGSQRTLGMLRFFPEERPFSIQIFGYDVERMATAAKMVEDLGADIVDINCGCPAPKVVRKGGGCELMRQPEHLQRIFTAVRRAVKIPLTMKMRSGWDEQSRNAVAIARMAEGEGVQAIAVHGRTRAQLYRGSADWDFVAGVADAVKVPVMGSGDVVDRATAVERSKEKITGLFIGRGAIENPFVFREIVSGAPVGLRSDEALQLDVIEMYIELLREEFPPKACIGKIKQLVSQMCRGQEWRKDLCRARTIEEQVGLLATRRTALRERGEAEGGYVEPGKALARVLAAPITPVEPSSMAS